jgi:hypothetical protein
MNDQPPNWLIAFMFFMMVMGVCAVVAVIVTFFVTMWEKYKGHKNGDDSGNDQGGGGWEPTPGPPPPGGGGGGPDLDHEEFHRELDLIGKTIEVEKEPVLHTEA